MLSNGQNPRRSQENGRNKAAIIRALCRIGRQVADLSHLAGLTTMLQTIALHESDCEIVDSARECHAYANVFLIVICAVHESLHGTQRTSRDVRSSVGIGGKADSARTTRFR